VFHGSASSAFATPRFCIIEGGKDVSRRVIACGTNVRGMLDALGDTRNNALQRGSIGLGSSVFPQHSRNSSLVFTLASPSFSPSRFPARRRTRVARKSHKCNVNVIRGRRAGPGFSVLWLASKSVAPVRSRTRPTCARARLVEAASKASDPCC
jgi:hypothetical protein